jgi:tetratricopeptide (TPR) repeat protein
LPIYTRWPWELAPLAASAEHWLERPGDDGPFLAHLAAGPLRNLGQFAAAEPLNRRSVAQTAPDHPSYPARINNLAILLQHTNRLAEAEPLYRRALAILERALGRDHPDVASALNCLASLLEQTNRLAEAESCSMPPCGVGSRRKPGG